ncbi:hypothetical protein P43SY_004334 [Pythium insidiosum]|uniref:Protein kinase domain-containing protein n=1 Tax=Pythium insidiosum TaxID=114742 RepID=A0AAD5Q976_PYTIN|nr:hypothetical protein P43SY_004334 [Pythium insidiosum]
MFARELAQWASGSGFAEMLVVSGADDMLRHDHNMLRRPLLTIGTFDAKTVRNAAFLQADSVSWTDVRGCGVAPLLHNECDALSLPFLAFILPCAEGDNVPDAVQMSIHTLRFLEIPFDDPATDKSGSKSRKSYQVQVPSTDIDGCISFSLVRCAFSILSLLLVLTDIPRTGLTVDFKGWPVVAPGVYIYYGPFNYPTATYVRNESSGVVTAAPGEVAKTLQVPVGTHIDLRTHALRRQFPDLHIDLTIITTRNGFTNPRSSWLPMISYWTDNIEVTTLLRARRCLNASACETVVLDDYRYERTAVESDAREWDAIIMFLRGSAQTYIWLRLLSAWVCCFYTRRSERTYRERSTLAQIMAASFTFFLLPIHCLIYSSWFPVVSYALAHILDSGVTHIVQNSIWSTSNGILEKFEFVKYTVAASLQMRNIWLIALAWKIVLWLHMKCIAAPRGRGWTQTDGLIGFRGLFIGSISSLTVFSFLRALRFRNTNVEMIHILPRHAPLRGIRGLATMQNSAEYGYNLDGKTCLVATVIIHLDRLEDPIVASHFNVQLIAIVESAAVPYLDGIDHRWKSPHEPSPAEKFAMAFGLDMLTFLDHMSSISGVDAFSNMTKCRRHQFSACPDGFVCGVRRDRTEGRCISRSAGLQDAWGRASMEVEIPACSVVKNGVTFFPEDLKALVTQFYFISDHISNQLGERGFKINDQLMYAATKCIEYTFLTASGVSLWDEQILLDRYIPTKQIQDIRMLGGGAFGIVYLVKIRHRQLGAAKRLSSSRRHDETGQRQLIDEFKLNAILQHPNIVALIGATWTTRADFQVIFEYMCDGDLRTYLEMTANDAGSAPMWSRQKLQLALDVAYALAYLHSQRSVGVVHRDLKSGNILLCRDTSSESRKFQDDGSVQRYRLRAKLADFGVSRSQSTNNSMTTGVGTSRWLAPEVILGGGVYDTACDVYSFGVVLTELDTHQLPFSDVRGADGTMLPDVTILQRVAHERLQPNTSALCPQSVASLARQCMARINAA